MKPAKLKEMKKTRIPLSAILLIPLLSFCNKNDIQIDGLSRNI
jgi:hypothetical protein